MEEVKVSYYETYGWNEDIEDYECVKLTVVVDDGGEETGRGSSRDEVKARKRSRIRNYDREYYERNKDEIIESAKEYYALNRDKIRLVRLNIKY